MPHTFLLGDFMDFPLSIADISLWLGVATIILLTTSELFYSSTYFKSKIVFDRGMLRLIGIICGLVFLVTVLMRFVSG